MTQAELRDRRLTLTKMLRTLTDADVIRAAQREIGEITNKLHELDKQRVAA